MFLISFGLTGQPERIVIKLTGKDRKPNLAGSLLISIVIVIVAMKIVVQRNFFGVGFFVKVKFDGV